MSFTWREVIQSVPLMIAKLATGGALVGACMYICYIVLLLSFLELIPPTWSFKPEKVQVYQKGGEFYVDYDRYSRTNQAVLWYAEIHLEVRPNVRYKICEGHGVSLIEAGEKTITMKLDDWMSAPGCSDRLERLGGEFTMNVYWAVRQGLGTKIVEYDEPFTLADGKE